ncbi:MAG: ASKHA domain-containing protein [Anaerolineales bacterium]|jgi:uncharacterized 2Fe-2S/4Fe-4S cluster protein (DUF4445 family)
MPTVKVVYGEEEQLVEAQAGEVLGDVISRTELPLEQPCAGRGTCGMCKVLAERGLAEPDDVEAEHLTEGELALNNRLACRARVQDDVRVILTPIVVYSNKIFRTSNRYKKTDTPLGLAVDLGSTTVAAFLTMMDDGEVCTGAASLNQQTIYGADVISRLNAASVDPAAVGRLHRLALASINQAVDSLKLARRIKDRIERVTIVGNVAMHHLLSQLPIESLARMPFQPHSTAAIRDAADLMEGIFPEQALVSLPPLIGGFVGSDALACLAYFGFDRADGPMAAIDLGTNGEVLVTDGERILTASTAAGPAFEGVNISHGTRAIDGAITQTHVADGEVELETIADEDPVGITGSGLLSVVHELREVGVIQVNGRIVESHPEFKSIITEADGSRSVLLTEDGDIRLTQWDVRELQKAKGAIRAAVDILMSELDLEPADLKRFILTGSFGGQVDVEAAVGIGMLPQVSHDIVENIANGAGFGAALFLTDEGFARGQKIAEMAEQIDLDLAPEFNTRYVQSMALSASLD